MVAWEGHHAAPMKRFLIGLILLPVLALPATGADWPQLRGPNRDGKSPETGLAPSWPEGGPRLAAT